VVTNDNPFNAMVAIVGCGLRDGTPLASNLILDFVSLPILSIDGTDQAIFYEGGKYSSLQPRKMNPRGNVLEMSAELEPRSPSTDVISCCEKIFYQPNKVNRSSMITHCTCP
jgi:hypothetical protein